MGNKFYTTTELDASIFLWAPVTILYTYTMSCNNDVLCFVPIQGDRNDTKLVVVSLSPQSRASIAAHYHLSAEEVRD